MRRSFILTAVLALLTLATNASVIFVKQGGTGSGSSWKDAIGDLNAALFIAQAGDEVWIAQGTYYPATNPKDRTATFSIPAGIKIYGGFAGHETSIEQRDFRGRKTILSGNIGSKSDVADNSYSVVYFKNAGESTLLDGFIVADGTANGTGPTADPERCGAAIYIDGSGEGNFSNPTIQNCIFQNNSARDGGAVYLNARGGNCSPTFRNCEFLNNKADLDGGAVFNDGRHLGIASPSFFACIFNGNKGNYGGAICNYGGKGTSSPVVRNCVFRNNEAFLRGGAIFNMDVEGEAKPVINDCQFVDNQAVAGEQIYTFSKVQPKRESMRTEYKMN